MLCEQSRTLGVADSAGNLKRKKMSPYIFSTGQRITIETQQDKTTCERFSRISFYVNSPIENVYRICRKLPSFPVFLSSLAHSGTNSSMRNHSRILPLGSGEVLSFEVLITRTVADQLICWETAPNEHFECEGCIRLSKEAGERVTRVRMDYSCKLRHGVAFESLSTALSLQKTKALKKSIRKLIKIIESEEEPHREHSWI